MENTSFCMLDVLSSLYKELGKRCSSFPRLILSGPTSKPNMRPRLLLEPLDDMHKHGVQIESTIQAARCKQLKNTKSDLTLLDRMHKHCDCHATNEEFITIK